jgi:AraC family transcriptional regulator, regulatory protein of adaptative response / methylated-DNA-[protein]-cysteine methyltransferase
MLTFKEKYNAIVRRDATYEGLFITAVKTTGIFCRPVCTARKPKEENVLFFNDCHEAIVNGFRPCKVCKPLEHADETPEHIAVLINEISGNPSAKITDYQLKEKGLEPNHIRRWFKKHHRMTFQAFQRMMRINTAFEKIQQGETITAVAYDVGFDSLSGFNETFKNIIGESGLKSKSKTLINIERITTPLGPMFIAATARGICMLEFTDRRMLETEFKDLQRLLKATILPGKNKWIEQGVKELHEYFAGARKTFTVPIDAPGSQFQRNVWEALTSIQYGSTVSYKEQAIRIGSPSAVRAVASANGCNRISIMIPCHRVIGEDGELRGYGGGLPRKKWLLDFEKKHR